MDPDVENENSPSLCMRISCVPSCQADHGSESTVPPTNEFRALVQMPAKCVCRDVRGFEVLNIHLCTHLSAIPRSFGKWTTEQIYDVLGLSLVPSQ